MAFTQADLQSAAAKLATLDFTAAVLEAIAATIRGDGRPEPDEVAGFVFEPNDEPLWARGFIAEVAGLIRLPGKGTTPSGGVLGAVSMEAGEAI